MQTKEKPDSLEKLNRSLKKFTLPDFLKPCVGLMLHDGFQKGGEFSRDRIAYIIATELRRVGKSPEVAEKILATWDRENTPPLGLNKLRSKIKSAYRTDYTFGCNNEPVILDYCGKINKDFCRYYKEGFLGRRKGSDRDFIKFGWPSYLSLAAGVVYFMALPELEKRRGIRPGEKIFASHREISKLCGLGQGTIGESLEKLAKERLITYKVGKPYRWRVDASEIERIIPIPKPKL